MENSFPNSPLMGQDLDSHISVIYIVMYIDKKHKSKFDFQIYGQNLSLNGI